MELVIGQKVSSSFFTENHNKILDWSGNNPDLNPIKNLWTKMKNLVSQKQPGSSSELVKTIKEVWVRKILGGYCQSLIYSMSRGLQAVINARGRHTKH